jgi:acetate CoA/acetoacetate CoA-transferase alpha subunit
LGGILTPTGLGTVVAEGKEKIVVDGKEYLLEKPLGADVALIRGYKADRMGNTVYYKTMRNFNPLMAMAADLVILEVDELVEIGELDPEIIVTPGIFVDYIVGRNQR